MPAQRIYAHPAVRMDVGRVALKRGPLVYCVEEVDNAGGPVQRLKLPRQSTVKPERRSDLFGGIVTLTADAMRLQDNGWQNTLYRSDPPAETSTTLTALPVLSVGQPRCWLDAGVAAGIVGPRVILIAHWRNEMARHFVDFSGCRFRNFAEAARWSRDRHRLRFRSRGPLQWRALQAPSVRLGMRRLFPSAELPHRAGFSTSRLKLPTS